MFQSCRFNAIIASAVVCIVIKSQFQMYIYEVSDGREHAYLSWQGDVHNGAADYVYISGLYANKLKLRDKLEVNIHAFLEKNGTQEMLLRFVKVICRNEDLTNVLGILFKYARYFIIISSLLILLVGGFDRSWNGTSLWSSTC